MARATFLLFFTILFGFFSEGWSVSDEHFEELLEIVNDQGFIIAQMRQENHKLVSAMQRMQEKCKTQATLIDRLFKFMDAGKPSAKDLFRNATIEERVSLLEIQVAEVEEEIGLLFQNDDFLFDEQVIQDDRLFELEQDSDAIVEELDFVEDQIEGLQASTLELDFRVTVLEENGGGGGNSSTAELEERVEALEVTIDDHQTDISDLESITASHESRLTSAEETVEGLLDTDIIFDERITALEEGGGGISQNSTVAFHVSLTAYDTIEDETTVVFNEVFFNEGNGYDIDSGTFTVPSGGEGFYYFSTDLTVIYSKFGWFYISVNGVSVCHTLGENDTGLGDYQHASCSAVVFLVEGDEVELIFDYGTDTTPLSESTSQVRNVFSGFRI